MPDSRPSALEPSLSALRFSTRACLISAMLWLTGCTGEVLFQSDFDATPANQPPAANQKVGTIRLHGAAGSVLVVNPPVTPSGKWVRITRADSAQAPVSGMQGNFARLGGDGEYVFSTVLFIPSGSGKNVASVQFESFGQSVDDLSGFLHIDFTENNRVRIDDNNATVFGQFKRDQAFILQVTLKINANPTAHIVLSGAGASGTADYTILGPHIPKARQFGAVRLWMGFPWSGAFDASTIVVKRK